MLSFTDIEDRLRLWMGRHILENWEGAKGPPSLQDLDLPGAAVEMLETLSGFATQSLLPGWNSLQYGALVHAWATYIAQAKGEVLPGERPVTYIAFLCNEVVNRGISVKDLVRLLTKGGVDILGTVEK